MMNKRLMLNGGTLVLLSVLSFVAEAKQVTGKGQQVRPGSVAKKMNGDDVFQANCQRCHMPPMSISRRTTGTVIMHMRTRARLSREDEIKLLHFMAP